MAVFGRLMTVAGIVVLLFVAYQLWGTGLREAANQRDLRSQFEEQVDAAASTDAFPDGPSGRAQASVERDRPEGAGSARAEPVAMHPSPGDPVAVLEIPALGLDKVVVEGTDVASLRKGPGHQPGTAPLGAPGNVVIAGHRTTYGAPFYRLDELEAGDPIIVRVPTGEVRYTVTGSQIVDPSDVWILEPTPDDRLTLFTCTPRFSAARRLVVTAALDGEPAVRPATAEAAGASPAGSLSADEAAPPQRPAELAAATGSLPTAVIWSLGTALIAGALWLLGRRVRRLIVYPLGAPVVAVSLFLTFEHVSALLPSAV